MNSHGLRPILATLGLLTALTLGAAFRLLWVEDIEYKADEAWTCAAVRKVIARGEGPWVGMPSSQNVHNPGLSLWLFYPLGAIFGTDEPTGLARGVQVLNVAAIILLAVFAWRCVPLRQRESWLWAVALISVNPLAVLFHRKIWPPSALPLLLVGLIAAWWHRDRRWGASLWGALATLVAQVHLAGFFHAAALATWTFFFDRQRTAWRWWLYGLAVGSYPMVPWVDYLATTRTGVRADAVSWTRLFEAKFYSHWASEPFGVGLKYAFGPDFAAFLAGPTVDGQSTYGVAALHGLVGLIGVGMLATAVRRWWPMRREWREWFGGAGNSTALLVAAVVWGYGLLLTATRLPFYRQYLLLAFPLTALWAARLSLPDGESHRTRGRCLLAVLVVAQGLITAAFLVYIHDHGGTADGYGMTYAEQVRRGEVMVPP